MEDGDRLSAQGIRSWLRTPRAAIHIYDTVGSTNDAARALAEKGAPHGTAVLAEAQTGGRGRFGRTFHSPAGRGVYMSLVLRPGPKTSLSLFTAAGAVAAARAIESVSGLRAQIKWVNDVLVDGKKVCGILAEAAAGPDGPFVVLGVGINFCARAEDFPPELRDRAGALYGKRPQDVTRDRLAAAVIDHVLDAAASPEDALPEYRDRSALLGKDVVLTLAGGTYCGRAVAIDDGGALVVQDSRGNRRVFAAGDVRVRGRDGGR
ncbi:MAG: biotin--[acetyl-CoA-carboxylase] ligase [Clostridiales bacterium]|jgi:BirA family biotin operon repressor/biotin-[acetyl-CoA-carboxylase] ligase|nr:biotin--[acetyl-CoA-carboxylase] ligase [Clostridiales bacterium]